jgi:hypothetical protein
MPSEKDDRKRPESPLAILASASEISPKDAKDLKETMGNYALTSKVLDTRHIFHRDTNPCIANVCIST